MTPEQQLESRKQWWSPTDDPNWDCDSCTCENNGDYCTYCLSFWMDREDTLERDGLL